MSVDARRVQAIFLAAVELPDAESLALFLDRECGIDLELREQVQSLLNADRNLGGLLKKPALAACGASSKNGSEDLDFANHERQPDVPDNTVPSRIIPDQIKLTVGFFSPPTKPGSIGRLGHYEVLELIGQGGFGIVLKAFDDVLRRVVAIKIMTAEMAATSPARKRFLREARASAAIRQENVVQIYAVEESPIPYLVMEYIPGKSLQEILDETGPLEIEEVLRIGCQVRARVGCRTRNGADPSRH